MSHFTDLISHLNNSCDNEYLVNYLTALEERLAILEGNRVQEPVVVKVSPQTLAESYHQLDSDAQDNFLADIGAKRLKKKKAQGKKSTKKRTKSAYQLFSDAHRAEVDARLRDASDDGKLPRGATMKELGAMWKKISEDEAAPFKERATELKAEAVTEQPTEVVSDDSVKATKKKTKKKTKKSTKKRTKSAYQLFSDDYRAEVDARLREDSETGKLPRGAVMKELGAMWKNVSKEDKKPFQEEAARLKAEAATEQPTETVQGDSADEFVVAPKNAQSDDKKKTKKTKKKTTDKKAKKKTQKVISNGDESEDDFGDFPDQFGASGDEDNLTDNEESD